jgi:uncharacterized protein (TIGR03435 family)
VHHTVDKSPPATVVDSPRHSAAAIPAAVNHGVSAASAVVSRKDGDIPASGSTQDRDLTTLPATSNQGGAPRSGTSVLQSIGDAARSLDASDLIDHLWQSTILALVAGLLTLAFRHNRASVRYWLWFAASVKFLVPFALLANLGSRWPLAPAAQLMSGQALSIPIERFSQPFARWSTALPASSHGAQTLGWMNLAVSSLWACGLVAIALIRLRMWQRIRAAVRASTPFETGTITLETGVEVRTTPGLLEPGVVGFRRPVLLLPADIASHLTTAQLEAVLSHELCHIRRRDNLTAAIHMIVEAVFWFHPLVWWVGARLVSERERACDEDVLSTFGNPLAYAEGILNLCKRYVDARLACVSGMSGSDLKKRIEAILSNQDRRPLSAPGQFLLAAAGVLAVAVPVIIGAVHAPVLRAQSPNEPAPGPGFEAASIKLNRSGDPGWRLDPQPGGRLTGTNVAGAALIRFAYDRPDFQVFGGPDWLDSDRFDVVANAQGAASVEQKRLMLRKLLAERFQLTAHTETRQLPMYALVLARSDGRLGPRLRRAAADCGRADQPSQDSGFAPSPDHGPGSCGFFGFAPGTDMPSGRGGLAFRGLTMSALAKTLMPMVRRSVSDETGLTGYFDADFDFMAELPPPPPPPGMPNPWATPFVSIFTVLPEQLGLKLDSRRGPVEVLVIDRAEPPKPD